MLHRIILLTTLIFAGFVSKGQIPQIGKSNTLEIASWNIEWFGSIQNGPTNENLQYTNVKNILLESNIDIWAMEEISDTAKARKLIEETGVYNLVFADYWQTQKTALAWRSSQFNLLSAKTILQNVSVDFANGRLPLEVKLCTRNLLDTFTILVIHLKAHTGSETEKRNAWFNRQKSAKHLETYLRQNAAAKIIIAGDWNDDIDKSIYNDTLSPFLNLVNSSDFHFLMQEKSLNGEHSYLYGEGMIDHLVVNGKMAAQYISSSAQVFYLQNAINDYGNTTSDHYPVFAKFSFTQPNGLTENFEVQKPRIWPNPAVDGRVNLSGGGEEGHWMLTDLYGRIVKEGNLVSGNQSIDITTPGNYFVVFIINNIVYYERLVVKG